jgi:hypothetical protein
VLVFSGGGRRRLPPPGGALPSSLFGLGWFFFVVPLVFPVVFCSPGFVSGGVVCPPSCWGYGVWFFVCFVVVFPFVFDRSISFKVVLGVTSPCGLPACFS